MAVISTGPPNHRRMTSAISSPGDVARVVAGWQNTCGKGVKLVVLGLGARFFLAAVFLAAGVSKLGSRDAVVSAVRGYDLLPDRLAGAVGASLAWVEVAFGACLLLGVATDVVSVGGACLLTTFALAVVSNLVRGRRIDCGCGSAVLPSRISWAQVARNAFLAGLCVISAVAAGGAIRLTAPVAMSTSRPATVTHALPGLVMGVCGWLLLELLTVSIRARRAALQAEGRLS